MRALAGTRRARCQCLAQRAVPSRNAALLLQPIWHIANQRGAPAAAVCTLESIHRYKVQQFNLRVARAVAVWFTELALFGSAGARCTVSGAPRVRSTLRAQRDNDGRIDHAFDSGLAPPQAVAGGGRAKGTDGGTVAPSSHGRVFRNRVVSACVLFAPDCNSAGAHASFMAHRASIGQMVNALAQ